MKGYMIAVGCYGVAVWCATFAATLGFAHVGYLGATTLGFVAVTAAFIPLIIFNLVRTPRL